MVKIKILSGGEKTWYKDFVGQEFLADIKVHPTFEYKYYQLIDCEFNRKYFYDTEDEELSLLFLRDGFTGVSIENADVTLELI